MSARLENPGFDSILSLYTPAGLRRIAHVPFFIKLQGDERRPVVPAAPGAGRDEARGSRAAAICNFHAAVGRGLVRIHLAAREAQCRKQIAVQRGQYGGELFLIAEFHMGNACVVDVSEVV